MLLIPFVENAFKHGNLEDGFLKVEINLTLIKNNLQFSIQNTSLNKDTKENVSGIGLENIKKRLELHYPNNYQLEIKNINDIFLVNLSISDINVIKNV